MADAVVPLGIHELLDLAEKNIVEADKLAGDATKPLSGATAQQSEAKARVGTAYMQLALARLSVARAEAPHDDEHRDPRETLYARITRR